jgi:hypothetical protein
LKSEIAAADGSKEKADWDRLLGMLSKSGYRAMQGSVRDVAPPNPASGGGLRAVVRLST